MGDMLGVAGPVAHPSRPILMDLEMEADSAFTFDEVPGDVERALYVVEGEVEEDGHTCGPRHLLVAETGSTLAVYARRPSRVVMLGGPPLQGKRFMDWNFVSSSRERIDRARAAWRAREFPAIPGDDQEFVPLPG
jgi:redox-sensitive bicupin YhaK (pirin superfamily)